jgi:hypothetical protein
MTGDKPLEGVRADASTAGGGENVVVPLSAPLLKPFSEDRGGVRRQWGAACLPSFPETPDMGAGAELHVSTPQAGELTISKAGPRGDHK